MRIGCWIPKAKNIHKGCVILIVFTMQQWFNLRASMLRYTYLACLVKTHIRFVILLCAFVCEDNYLFCLFDDAFSVQSPVASMGND
jgi:hypothetical protein